MSQKYLDILGQLTERIISRQYRLTDLLKAPQEDYTNDWYMCVPKCFNDALDLKKTDRVVDTFIQPDLIQEKQKKKEIKKVWTQGSYFSFGKGDTLYDSPKAYSNWDKALKNINLCVQVEKAIATTPSKVGIVTFSILTPNENHSKLVNRGEHTMSQDNFVRFLIAGPSGAFKDKIKKYVD